MSIWFKLLLVVISKRRILAYKEDTDRTVAALKERELELIKVLKKLKSFLNKQKLKNT